MKYQNNKPAFEGVLDTFNRQMALQSELIKEARMRMDSLSKVFKNNEMVGR